MMHLFFIVALTLIASAQAQWNTFCGGAGQIALKHSLINPHRVSYDVSSLIGSTLRYSSASFLYILTPCGSISNATDSACFNDAEARYGAMFCQRNPTATSVYTLANWNETVARSGTQWVALANGVSMRVQVGERCGAIGNWREVTVEFICDASATTPVFVSVSEPETCWYVATVRTSSACATVGPTMSNQVGASWYALGCGGSYYDLRSLGQTDLHYENTGFNYWVRVCGLVNTTECTAAGATSFCQKSKTANSSPFDMSDFNTSVPNLHSVTPIGLDIDIKSGVSCGGNGPRQATYHLVCNPRATNPILSYVYETPVCWYHAVIQTSTVCTGTNLPGQGYCGGAGYDLTEVSTMDLVLTAPTRAGGSVYNWYLHPCRPLSPWFTNACSGKESMFCQQNNDTKVNQNIASWNRTVSDSATWMAITNGVQLYFQNGDGCPAASNLPRDTAIQFLCDRTAGTPIFVNVTEPETCYYVATILTEAACDTVSATAPHVPGATYLDSVCGGGYLDLSDIRDEMGDLAFDTNPGQPTGFMFYIELCGAVSTTGCSSVQPSMLCQIDKSNANNTYSIAQYQEDQLVEYTVNDNGLTMKMSTGTPCGGIPRRQVTINIVCDGASPAQMTSVREIETCHYVAIIHGRCDYGNTEPFSTHPPVIPRSSSTGADSSDSSSKSSSLSGGAIAGIVIGSVVGALVLLAVLCVLCCGIGRSGQKKNKFSDMSRSEESRTGEVEMESA